MDQEELRFFLIVNAIVFGSSGILAQLFQTNVLSLNSAESGPAVPLMAQYAGLESLAIAHGALFGINLRDPKAQFAVKRAFLITCTTGGITSVSGTISGLMKIGMAVVGLNLLFAIGFSYILLLKMPSQINSY